jgi:hypothetical protein
MIIHTNHKPLQFMQTQGKLQNDFHQKWSMYLQQFHLNIKYKKGNTNACAILNLSLRSNFCTLLYLPQTSPGSQSPWITCQVFPPPSMVTIMSLWLSIGSLRWPFWHHVRRVSQLKPLLSSSLSMFGFILGYHDHYFR